MNTREAKIKKLICRLQTNKLEFDLMYSRKIIRNEEQVTNLHGNLLTHTRACNRFYVRFRYMKP